MAYMHVCPKCRSFFKVKTKDTAIRCPKCSYQYLLDLKMDDEAWGTLTSGEKKTIIKTRVSEEGLTDVVASGSGPAKPASASQPSAGDENKQVKKTVKKVVKKKVVKRVVKKVVKKPEAALTEKEPVTDRKDVVREEAYKEPVRKEEAAAEAAQTSEPEKRPDVRPEEKKIRQLVSFLKAGKEKTGSDNKETPEEKESKEASETEEKTITPTKEKTKLNRKYVAIVSGTMGVLLLYLITMTFIIPSFRMRNELPYLRAAEAGDTVYFGKYKGQNEWVVLDRKGTRILCISDYPIYGHDYYDEGWEESDLRKWFNSVFINSSFNVYERLRIMSTKDIMEEDPDYLRDVGADIPDKVFIITERELKDYLHQYRDAMIRVNDDDIRAVCWIETK